MQQEHRLALTSNYVLLVNETPVDDILDELVQQNIIDLDYKEFIMHHPTRKGRTRALLELLPRRGPKAFHAFCYALMAKKKEDLVSVLCDPEKEDMEVCFPEQSRFHLGGTVYLIVEEEGVTLKDGRIELFFPLVRWVQLQYFLDDIDEAVHYMSHNRYASLEKHLGGNVYVKAQSPKEMIDFRQYWFDMDQQLHPTPQGIVLNFEQYEKLKDADKAIPDLIPEVKNMLPCYMTHQNIEGAIFCSECHPNGPDTDCI